MGFIIRVNGRAKPSTIFSSPASARAEESWWRSHLQDTGSRLDSFEIEPYDDANPEHHTKPCPFAR